MNRRAFLLSIPAVAVVALAAQPKPAMRVWQTDYVSMDEVTIWDGKLYVHPVTSWDYSRLDSAKTKVVGLL